MNRVNLGNEPGSVGIAQGIGEMAAYINVSHNGTLIHGTTKTCGWP